MTSIIFRWNIALLVMITLFMLSPLLSSTVAYSYWQPCHLLSHHGYITVSTRSRSPLQSLPKEHSSIGHIQPDDDSKNDPSTITNLPPASFQIQPCQYSDLNVVSDIIMESFYKNESGKNPLLRFLQLAELNRLQQNFPYVDKHLHQMFVAIIVNDESEDFPTNGDHRTILQRNNNTKKQIVGFVDIDARPCQTEIKLPRPYLSDLAVHPDHRRKGIAQALVTAGEGFIRHIPRNELFIRVEEKNQAAVNMYLSKLNYTSRRVEVTRDNKRIMTLHKSI